MSATAALTMQAATMFAGLSANKQASNAAKAEGDYAAGIADRNASLADRQAADAIARGAESEGRFRVGTRGLVGAERTNAAASGIDVGSGSAMDVQADTARFGEMDALTIRNNARRQAWGFGVDASNQRAAAENARIGTENTVNALKQKSYTTLLTGSAGLADQWKKNPPSFGRRSPATASSVYTSSSGLE